MDRDGAVEAAPGTSDFESLGQRMRSLLALRLGFALLAVGVGLLGRGRIGGPQPGILESSGVYVALEAGAEIIRRRGNGRRLFVLSFGVLLDGVYLTWITFLTGGIGSPFQSLIYVHLIAISLIASYRTGLKLAFWDSLLLVTFAYAESSGTLHSPAPLVAFGSSLAPGRALTVTIPALWAVAIATAALAAVNERVLRRKRADLEMLTRTVAEFGESESPHDITQILLERLQGVVDVRRGLVLASPEGELELLAAVGLENATPIEPGMDRVVERAFTTRSVQLVQRLDPIGDPRLTALMPEARGLLVVPLFLAGGYRLGVLVAERAGRGDRIHGWTVAIVQQFASHAAVRLHNAWLLEDNRGKLDEIRHLRDELVGKNLTLESRVIERTQELSESLERLRSSDADRQRLLSHLVRAQEDERRRIAGDIHDDPLQLLVGVTMRLDMMRRQTADPTLSRHASELRELVRNAVGKLRNLMFELRPEVLEEQGLAAALYSHADQWRFEPELEVHDRFRSEPSIEPRLILYRIAQESFANIRKHSKAGRVDVTLEQRGGSFFVRIIDDGVGFNPSSTRARKHGHIGLTSMRERAELAGGGCRIHSLPGDGTTVEFWVPEAAGMSTSWVDEEDPLRTLTPTGPAGHAPASAVERDRRRREMAGRQPGSGNRTERDGVQGGQSGIPAPREPRGRRAS